MSYQIKTGLLFEEYGDRVSFGMEESDEALQNAIDWVFRDRTDEFRADVFSKLSEVWHVVELRFINATRILKEAMDA